MSMAAHARVLGRHQAFLLHSRGKTGNLRVCCNESRALHGSATCAKGADEPAEQQPRHSSISSHISADGATPTMVDVGAKATTRRTATARALVKLPFEVANQIKEAGGDIMVRKGPLYSTAILAGVMAAKQTSTLIPLCHPLPLEDCKIKITAVEADLLQIDCTVRVTHKTGVEMEAMTGASVAALTVYDMLKGLSHDIVIQEVRLLAKDGGKRTYRAPT